MQTFEKSEMTLLFSHSAQHTHLSHSHSPYPGSPLEDTDPRRSQKVPERAGGRKRNKDSRLDLCPKASIAPPALLFVPGRVKPYRQGSYGVMDLALEGWGRWVKREVGVVCPSSEATRMNNLLT